MPGLTIPHLVDFGEARTLVGDELAGGEKWDALRTRTDGPFALPAERAAWEASADAAVDIETRMRALDALLDELGARSVASYGAGSGLAELWLQRLSPGRALAVTEHAPETAARLRRLFTEATVVEHDLLADPPLEADVHLLHRVDTEFTNRQWRRILRRFGRATVVLVASEVLTGERARHELRELRRRRDWTRAGWIRTEGAFRGLWRRTHRARRVELADLTAFVLVPRRG